MKMHRCPPAAGQPILRRATGVVLALVLGIVSAHAATVYVAVTGDDATGDGSEGTPYRTVQHGFDQAVAGDTILVKPGIYQECVRALGFPAADKPVQLIAEDWQLNQRNDTTIIDGETTCGPDTAGFRDSAVIVASSGSRFEGFTVRGGGNAGISTQGSTIITNNVITGNESILGGGIYFYNAGCRYGDTFTTISNNDIVANKGVEDDGFGGDGGGIYARLKGLEDDPGPCAPADPVVHIIGNTIRNNEIVTETDRTVFGGGLVVFVNSSANSTIHAVISQNTISDNTMGANVFGYGGGGWITTYGYGTEIIDVLDNEVKDNHSTLDGGGLSTWIQTEGVADSQINHTVTVRGNTFEGNSSDGNGGGLDAFMFVQNLTDPQRLEMIVDNNQASGNTALGDFGGGGGMLASLFVERTNLNDITFNLTGNSITGNTAQTIGGGLGVIVSADADPPTDLGELPVAPLLSEAEILMSNNLITGNDANGTQSNGGGAFAFLQAFGLATSRLRLDRMTIADNQATFGAGGLEIESSTGFDFDFVDQGDTRFVIENSIVSDNGGFGIGGAQPGIEEGFMAPTVDNLGNLLLGIFSSDVFAHPTGNYEGWVGDRTDSVGNISADPLLDELTYVPSVCSPTIDAGDAIPDVGAEPMPNGDRINMGHTAGTVEATPGIQFLDASGDGLVDGIDVLRVATSFATTSVDARYSAAADLDDDNDVDGDDLALVCAAFGRICE